MWRGRLGKQRALGVRIPAVTYDAYSREAVRTSILAFLVGKAGSALLTIINLVVLVRVLTVTEYGFYVTLIAVSELAYSLCSCGLPWVSARFIPEFRLHASGRQCRALAAQLLGSQVGILVIAVCALAYWREDVLAVMRMPLSLAASVAWLILILVEGSSRFCADGLLGPLLKQKAVSLATVSRQGAFFVLIITLATGFGASLESILLAEVSAALVGFLVAVTALRRSLRTLGEAGGDEAWVGPGAKRVLSTAVTMYAGSLFYLFYSPQAFIVVLQRFLGPEATATFGFIRSIYEQMARYLPATLLFSIIRPKLVATYVGHGGLGSLLSGATLAGKLSLFGLLPAVGFVLSRGETLVSLLSGGQFPETGLLLFAFTLILVPLSQRQLLETVVLTIGHGAICTTAAVTGVLGLPVMLWGLQQGLGIWVGVVALGIGHTVFVAILVFFLRKKVGYESDVMGFAKLGLVTALAAGVAAVWPAAPSPWIDLLVSGLATLLAFLAGARLVRPFSDAERATVNVFIGKKWFVW